MAAFEPFPLFVNDHGRPGIFDLSMAHDLPLRCITANMVDVESNPEIREADITVPFRHHEVGGAH